MSGDQVQILVAMCIYLVAVIGIGGTMSRKSTN